MPSADRPPDPGLPDPAQPSRLWPTAWWRAAYTQGWFPMADPQNGRIELCRSLRRALLPLDDRFHVPRSLGRVRRAGGFQLRLNREFDAVLADCADRPSTWINPELGLIYQQLHRDGLAHSVELHDGEGLAAGMLGLSIGACWIGESMAHRRPKAGNLLLVELVAALRAGGFRLFDVQLSNPHLQRFGCLEIGDALYCRLLADAVGRSASLRLQDGWLVSEARVAQ
jgi:leucyl/phenylalanyl-tRNA--protein transferase